MTSTPIPEISEQSRAGDVLLLPIGLIAFWTLAYDLVLITRWPAQTLIWCFLAIAVVGFIALRRLWKATGAIPGKGYRFQTPYLLLLLLGLSYAATALFVRRPNQDDVVYFHRALTQLLHLQQPIFLHQTSVDMDAAAFSPVHLTTSYEMLMALSGHYLRIDPLYFYQVIGHVCAAFSVPFVFYWCTRTFGLHRWTAAVGALLGTAFLLLADPWSLGALLGAASPLVSGWSPGSLNIAGWLGFATVSRYMWQGKPIVWILFLPIALALSYRYLSRGNLSDLLWIVLVAIAGVGLSNPALYLIPAVIACSWVAFAVISVFEPTGKTNSVELIRVGFFLLIPLVYPIGILILLTLNVIPKPIDIRMFGPEYMPWREAMDHVIGGPAEYWRDVILMLAVPLLIVRGKSGRFIFYYLCAVWLLFLNPLFAPWWMKHLLAYCYFRLVYLLPLPLLCAMSAVAGPRLTQTRNLKSRLLTSLAVVAIVVSFCFSYHGLSITPRDAKLGVGWKSPGEYQLLPANLGFAEAAGKYIAHSKVLMPTWTAGCELPLLFPEMKVVSPRFVIHYFANAGNPGEGNLRQQAELFIDRSNSRNSQQLSRLEPKFREVIETGRANAVAVPESEAGRVLATLKSIDPGWHQVLQAGGLTLMLPKPR
ncbi:MAG: hypothetical protein ACM3KL_01535 [Alphaproteobacteria bacterium]